MFAAIFRDTSHTNEHTCYFFAKVYSVPKNKNSKTVINQPACIVSLIYINYFTSDY